MGLFTTRTIGPLGDREQVLNEEIARLEKEIRELKSAPSKPKAARSVASKPAVVALPVVTPSASLPSLLGAAAVPPVPLPPASAANSAAAVTATISDPIIPLVINAKPAPRRNLENLTSVAGVSSGAAAVIDGDTIRDPHFNEQGVRKFDFMTWWRGLLSRFGRRTAGPENPEMIKYLATGSLQGLRPLKYERRIARNRTVGLIAVLVLVLYGLAWVFLRA